MCGFCLSINDAGVDIRRLTESIRHRGPDSTKYYLGTRVLCGFNRLAIVDNDAHSDQPMLDPSGRYLLAFNGEIYNYETLRAALVASHGVRFRTRSDTEVLLAGLQLEGKAFVAKLDGIFAFAFVDLQSLHVLLARDTFGVKPLYFYSVADRLYVSSEVRPLQVLSGNRLQAAGIARYLSYGMVGDGGTIVSGISELEPNTLLTLDAGRVTGRSTIHRFDYDRRESASIDEIGKVLYESIDSQRPSIPYGVLFSGGLDSTLVLDRCGGDGNLAGAYAIDVGHAAMSERRWQEHAVAVLGLERIYRRIELGKEDLSLQNIAAVSANLDHPLFHPNFIGSFLLTRHAAADGLKVLLSGEGADELFLGYRWFFSGHPAADFLEYVPLQDVGKILGAEAVHPLSTSGMSLLEIFQRLYLRRWLSRQDLTGMANSVEVRVPFLGLRIADLMNRLSMRFKAGDGRSKWILKSLLAGRFAGDFVERKKIGFDFPLNDWIGDEHIDFLRQKSSLIDRDALESALRKHEGSYMKHRLVFALVALSLWQEGAAA